MTARCHSEGCQEPPKWIAKYLSWKIKTRVTLCDVHLEQLKTIYKDAISDLKWYVITPEVKKIDRSFEQFECPNCREPILLPEIRFFPDEDELKKRSIFCVVCRSYYLVRLGKTGPIDIFEHGNIKKYDKVLSVMACRGATPVYYRRDPITNQIETRCGIILMGTMNFPQMQGACPFDANFRDNYIQGYGITLEESLKALLDEGIKISKGLIG